MAALPPALGQRARSRPLAAFLLVSFAFSWLFAGGFLRYVDPVVDFPLSQVASLPFAWGPLVGAAVVGAATTDATARGWVAERFDVGVPFRWLALAFLVPVLVQDLPALLLAAQGEPVVYGVRPMHALVFAFTFALGGALEEFGWRGLLQDRLQARWGALSAAAAVGVAWALWHLPLHAAGYTFADDNLALFTVYLVGLSVAMAWLYNATAGVLPVMVLHAAHNMPGFVAPADGVASPLVENYYVVTAALWLAFGVVVAAYYGPDALARSDSTTAPGDD